MCDSLWAGHLILLPAVFKGNSPSPCSCQPGCICRAAATPWSLRKDQKQQQRNGPDHMCGSHKTLSHSEAQSIPSESGSEHCMQGSTAEQCAGLLPEAVWFSSKKSIPYIMQTICWWLFSCVVVVVFFLILQSRKNERMKHVRCPSRHKALLEGIRITQQGK